MRRRLLQSIREVVMAVSCQVIDNEQNEAAFAALREYAQ